MMGAWVQSRRPRLASSRLETTEWSRSADCSIVAAGEPGSRASTNP
jgi:hypothetical protein